MHCLLFATWGQQNTQTKLLLNYQVKLNRSRTGSSVETRRCSRCRHMTMTCYRNVNVISVPPPEQFLFSSTCFPPKVSNGLAASPTSLCAALLTNQTPSRSLEQEPEVMAVVSPWPSWLQLWRRQWTTWRPCALVLPAMSAPAKTIHTWVRCRGY